MNRSLLIAPLAPALLALAACGGKDSSGGGETNVAIDTAATGAVVTATRDDGGMTAIDAATGEAGAMPADFSGPTAYDLDRDKEAALTPKVEAAPVEKSNEAEAEPPAPETPSAAQ